MTLLQAIHAKVRIKPGRRIRTMGGWCRHDRVLLDGHEIGKIQTRSGRGRTEVLTIAGNVYVMGHDIDWLVSHEVGENGLNSTTARSV